MNGLIGGYAALDDRYDELLDRGGAPRGHWSAFLDALARREGRELADTLALTERQIREHGITYNVYADRAGADRPWEIDPLPLILPAAEWEAIEAGIVQRAELLNRVLADLYGPQTLLASGAVPAPVVFGQRSFLHPVQGLVPAGGRHLVQYAADLARSPDGRWWVVSDRTQAPSGSGYALENRLLVSRVFPQLFRELPIERLAAFFEALRESILAAAPRGDGPTRIVLLTPGPYNETYFEHALLARYLGFTLVEGSDLVARDDRVWLKTTDGLTRVHAIVRRQDDDYCDPLELRSDSALGIPGLVECARRGTVLLANALGCGVLESGALLGYLPRLARRMLGEELRLPSVGTWWLGEPAAFEDAWRKPESLIVKPLERAASEPPVVVESLDAAGRAELLARIRARPQAWVAQEWVRVSQAPVLLPAARAARAAARAMDLAGGRAAHAVGGAWAAPAIAPRTVGLRVFAVATPGGWRVMPGGLARVAADESSRVIAMQRGGRSKDTWVLSDRPVNDAFTLLSTTVDASRLVSADATLASRAAENLFWFGRYGERAEQAARLLRVALGVALEQSRERPGARPAAWRLAERLNVIEPSRSPPRALRRAATDPECALHQRLRQLGRTAFTLRERMSADHWRTLNRLVADPVFTTEQSLPMALVWLDRCIASMVTLSGFFLDGMTRGSDWRFLSLGRRVERLSTLATALQVATTEGRGDGGDGGGGLDWLLELADSSVTYNARYLAAPEWMPVLDTVLRDPANPRSLAFQVRGIADGVARIEARHGPFGSHLVTDAVEALAALEPADLAPESERKQAAVLRAQRAAHDVSDALSLRFFTHAAPRSQLAADDAAALAEEAA
jgi:uncharacterized circularly permuted ATP-grasp superfamily protein/uncharacterized alpha-E superfamily protein